MRNKIELAIIIFAALVVGFLAGRVYEHWTNPSEVKVFRVTRPG